MTRTCPPAWYAAPIVPAILSGLSFAGLGTVYVLADRAGFRPIDIIWVSSLAAMLAFGFRDAKRRRAKPGAPPRMVITSALLAGATQYVTLLLIGAAVRMGPLSALWCATSLGFIPVIIMSALFFREPLDRFKQAGVTAAIACVLAASFARQGHGEAVPGGTLSLHYTGVLLAVLLTNSGAPMALKVLGMRQTDQGRTLARTYRSFFLALMYAIIALGSLVTAFGSRTTDVQWIHLLLFGGAAALFSMLGMSLLAAAAHGNAAVVFTANGISSILAAAVMSILALGEPVSIAWGIAVTLGTASIFLVGRSSRQAQPPQHDTRGEAV
jgi:drug/metabolite transporter (DMT)-like permease